MAQGKRSQRVAVLIKEELSSVLTKYIRDPRIGFITVTHVEVSDDLKYAKVFYSARGNQEKKDEAQIGLENAKGYLRRDIAHAIKLRCTPERTFVNDPSLDEGLKIDVILQKIHKEQ
ncbi:MAG: ribosome-binding factor A [Omnitrophica bacterium RIFCSPLOWO2_02_FULL_44_11]|nr:MAG: ribosome-binding factor A [Omnitrophica bacterium RIFCSPLOWO2_02_FULL_44_11]